MNALVIGLGSAGKRHAQILAAKGLKVFSVSSHFDNSENNFRTLREALDSIHFDYVVISNETSQHQASYDLLQTLGYKKKILIEKPINFPNDYHTTSLHSNTFVGFNLRYLPVIRDLKQSFTEIKDEIIEIRLEYGNSTDNWRNGDNRKLSYSRSVKRGGGVLRDFSHEIDLALWVFGVNELRYAYGTGMGDFMLDGEDYVKLILKGEQKYLVEVTLNSLQKVPSRLIQIRTSCDLIEFNLLNGVITWNNKIQKFDNSIEQTYIDMHDDILNSNAILTAKFHDGLLVDRIILLAEECMQQKRELL